jgi:hypothetical protein
MASADPVAPRIEVYRIDLVEKNTTTGRAGTAQ